MSGIALTYKLKQTDAPQQVGDSSVDLHIDYWKLPHNSAYQRFIDFGIMIHNARSIDSISLYVPFKDENILSRIEDLGEVITSGTFLSVLFNEDYVINTDSRSPFYKYATSKGKAGVQKSFWIYILNQTNFEIVNTPYQEGSLITIRMLASPDTPSGVPQEQQSVDQYTEKNYDVYLRFRINDIKIGEFSTIESIDNDPFQSIFSQTELVNIHLNSIRDIDMADYQLLKTAGSFFNLNKVHFYFVGSTQEETITGGAQYQDCVLLDSKHWKNYIKIPLPLNRNCVSYHWKFDQLQNTCHIFCRTIFKSSNWKKICIYIAIVVLTGIFASYIANLIPTSQAENTDIEQVSDSIHSQSPSDDRETTER